MTLFRGASPSYSAKAAQSRTQVGAMVSVASSLQRITHVRIASLDRDRHPGENPPLRSGATSTTPPP